MRNRRSPNRVFQPNLTGELEALVSRRSTADNRGVAVKVLCDFFERRVFRFDEEDEDDDELDDEPDAVEDVVFPCDAVGRVSMCSEMGI